MKRCASCGASYDEDRTYCPECGVAADEQLPELSSYDAEPTPKPEVETSGDPGARKHAVALLTAVALVVVGVVAYVVVQSPDDDDDDDRRSVPPPTSTMTPTATVPTTTSKSPATTTNPPPPEDKKVGLVSMPAALAEQPSTREVARLLDTFFAAINNQDFEGWKSVLMPVEDRDFEEQWKGLVSTHDSDIKLFHVEGTDQSMTADVSFTSRQDPEFGPRGEACTRWDVTYLLVRSTVGTLLIDRVDESRTTSRACAGQ